MECLLVKLKNLWKGYYDESYKDILLYICAMYIVSIILEFVLIAINLYKYTHLSFILLIINSIAFIFLKVLIHKAL